MISQSAHILVINKKGEILLTQRKDVPLWVIPGGHLEKNETPEKAVKRELFEETGLNVGKVNLVACYSRGQQIMEFLLKANASSQVIINQSPEVRNAGWFSPKHLPTPTSLYELKRIEEGLSSSGKIFNRSEFVNKKAELFNQFKNPLL